MKKLVLLSLLAAFFTLAFHDDALAQKKGKKKKSSSKKEKTDEYFDESGFTNKLWYGGGFNLGFAGNSTISQFVFGVSPMVGYKVFGDYLSVGPRIGFLYNHFKIKDNAGGIHKAAPLSYTAGVFARVKPFQNFFAHAEYEYENTGSIDPNDDGFIEFEQNGDVVTGRVPRNNVYLGAGYSSGGLWGYEILLLFNVNQPDYVLDSPFNIRFGITHKF